MSKTILASSRRGFIRLCGSSAALFYSGMCSAKSAGLENKLLAFRVNAAPLLLNYNENSLGMSPSAVSAAMQATQNLGNRYPDDLVEQLRETLATLHDVSPKQIILGNGSTEVIQAVVTMAEGRAATVIEPTPTFGDVQRYSQAEDLEVVKVPVGKGFQTDIGALRKKAEEISGTVLINICNPNNPTGSIVDNKSLTDWIMDAPQNHIFLIDEAYYEYAASNPAYSSVLPLIKLGRENVILTRTFSKIYGMAGMRVGYGIAAQKTAEEVRQFAAGYNLSAPGSAAALASLVDTAFFKRSLESNQLAKLILLTALDELGLEYVQSHTNFVLHRINGNLEDYAARMAANGIKVGRRMTSEDGWNRLSVGTPDEMRVFVQTLKAFQEKAWL
ncbi:MAG: histidinol-phosphate aminotransferase [Arenicella sp.]|jgi:histidinol-phosphate aminotransferase